MGTEPRPSPQCGAFFAVGDTHSLPPAVSFREPRSQEPHGQAEAEGGEVAGAGGAPGLPRPHQDR